MTFISFVAMVYKCPFGRSTIAFDDIDIMSSIASKYFSLYAGDFTERQYPNTKPAPSAGKSVSLPRAKETIEPSS